MVAPKSRGPIYKAQLQFFENFSNGILSAPYGLKVMVFCYSLVFQLLNVKCVLDILILWLCFPDFVTEEILSFA